METIYISYKNKNKSVTTKNFTYLNVKIVDQVDLNEKFDEIMSQEFLHSDLNYY
jgi:hypothetical protein